MDSNRIINLELHIPTGCPEVQNAKGYKLNFEGPLVKYKMFLLNFMHIWVAHLILNEEKLIYLFCSLRPPEASGDVLVAMERLQRRSSKDQVRSSILWRKRTILTPVLDNLTPRWKRTKMRVSTIKTMSRTAGRRKEDELQRLTKTSPSVKLCCQNLVVMKTPGPSWPRSTPSSFLLTRKSSGFPWTSPPSGRNSMMECKLINIWFY